MKYIVAICRILVGVLFIISGLIKANDPIGFSYKLQEYFEVFGMEFFVPFALTLSVLITVFEIVCGVATLIGSRMKLFSWLLLLMIIFFTFLTFYSAYFNKVTDCGCFGDALHLTPWQSFTKDIVLLVWILPIFLWRNKIQPLFSSKLDNGLIIASTIISIWFNINCIMHLPAIDFRPYKVGTDIAKAMEIPEGAQLDVTETVLYYQKDGVTKEFTTKNYPWQDTLWKWVKTENKVIVEGYKPPIHDFTINTPEGENITDSILRTPGFTFMLVAYDIKKTDVDVLKEVNNFQAECEKNKIPFFGISGSIGKDIEDFRHQNQCMYPFYSCDGTALKTIIRSNPGLVLLEKGVVKGMWHHNDFPDFKDLNKTYTLTK
jgi:uncharacterized membrane protein YphA (DoxX/SURF4 family)